ncbi:hypothetical protein [Streptomyces sp. 2P-4]|uniref:hypothetical protein n=1 Tax=Streptomyces TaxID=1883 RepID=UPI002540F4CB|nr:hypothetical protein [Streptomyces sp. 2P-4]
MSTSMTEVSQATLDLTIDEEVFSSPGGATVTMGADQPEGTTTFATTCWGTCAFTCGDCETISCCSC